MSDAILTVSGVHTHYGRAHILSDVALEVRGGEVVVLLGRNGAGKSTTFKSIVGLVRLTRGEVFFRGKSIHNRESHEIARMGLGYVPEERRIFTELTVMENLEVGRQPTRGSLEPWTPERLFEMFPNLAEMRDRPGGRMSGGEQQMLTIARTLMGNPSVVLFDEPSEGLAPRIVGQMARMIGALKEHGLSVLLAEQNLRFAGQVAEKVYVIETGRIRWKGAMAKFLADSDVQRAYFWV